MRKHVWYTQLQSLHDLRIYGRLSIVKIISLVSAILGPNPFTGKVELEQETVVFKEKELIVM